MNDLSPHWPTVFREHERSVTGDADSPHDLLSSAVTCLERGDADGSMMFYHFADQAERLVERAGSLLTGLLKEHAGIAAEYIRVARIAFPSGSDAHIEYVRALRDAVGEVG